MAHRMLRACAALVLGTVACGLPPAPPLPANQFAFAVFGDAPYRAWEMGRYRRVIADVNQADLAWFLHVGDLLWYPCSDEALADRLDRLNQIQHPVVYVPGDNEWTDCHERIAGRFTPLERLGRIRATYFADPFRSLGDGSLPLESQSADSAFAEFVENRRWRYGGFVFATLHVVGSGNGMDPFPGRTAADDDEVARRTSAVLGWMQEAFTIARATGAHGLVLVWHADPWQEGSLEPWPEYRPILERLAQLVRAWEKPVLLIHGDSHTYRVDRPLRDPVTGTVLERFTRLETFGSPDVGWVRVIMDSVSGRLVGVEPRRYSPWLLW